VRPESRRRTGNCLAELLADTEESEYLNPGEVEILNAYEMEEAAKARARLAVNPCIQFSNIPICRVWRTTDSLTPSRKNWLLSRGLPENPAEGVGELGTGEKC
jgi:hypothetical protein